MLRRIINAYKACFKNECEQPPPTGLCRMISFCDALDTMMVVTPERYVELYSRFRGSVYEMYKAWEE